jgi:hypothetical protein
MHVFLMLCSNDKNSGHEGIALQLTMRNFFEVLGGVRLNAIVIDKNKIEYESYRIVIEKIHNIGSMVLWEGHERNVIFCFAILIQKNMGKKSST